MSQWPRQRKICGRRLGGSDESYRYGYSDDEIPAAADIINTVNSMGNGKTRPYTATLKVNGKPLQMEIDTGA